jgi:hypothetical protein
LTRLKQLIDRLGLNNAVNGVIRAEVLRRTRLHRPFAGSDVNLMAELILEGKFIEIPEPLFYRRINALAYAWSLSELERQKKYWPNNEKAVVFSKGQLLWEFFAIALRTPFSYDQRSSYFC